MQHPEPRAYDTADALEIARQAEVELAILLGIEQSLRNALQWMTRGRGNSHKLSTLRFHTWSFERHLTRIKVLADHGGYMHLITDANPHLAGKVETLRNGRDELHANLERIIIRLERVSRDDAGGFGQLCVELERFLDDLRLHGEKERELLALLPPRRGWIRMRVLKGAFSRAFGTGRAPDRPYYLEAPASFRETSIPDGPVLPVRILRDVRGVQPFACI